MRDGGQVPCQGYPGGPSDLPGVYEDRRVEKGRCPRTRSTTVESVRVSAEIMQKLRTNRSDGVGSQTLGKVLLIRKIYENSFPISSSKCGR